MKKILPWLKNNWLLTVMAVLMLAAIPTGWFFSTSWRQTMQTDREKIAADLSQKLSKAKVSYTVASPVPSVNSITANQEANSKVTEFFATQKAKFESEAKRVVELANAHTTLKLVEDPGSKDVKLFEPLIEDLFPAPKKSDTNRQIVAFTKELAGTPGKISAYQRMLNSINAGMPPDRKKIGQELSDRAAREREAMKGTNPQRELTKEEVDSIVKKLTDQRIGAYQQAAARYSVYASMESLPNNPDKILRQNPSEPPSLAQCFSWQADLWLVTEVFEAVKNANTPAGATAPISLDRAAVKRIQLIDFEPYIRTRDENDPYSNAPAPAAKAATSTPVDGTSAMIAPRFAESITGRWGGKENKLYDVRYCKLYLVAASARIPEVLNAISRSNFMTVVDVDIKDVDVWEDLQEGFYYGDEHVVHLTLEIEVVWLKGWLAPLVPPGAREQLGFPPIEGLAAPEAREGRGPPAGGGPPKGNPRRDR